VNVGIVYTVAISLLSLATPISVQLLINSVARTAQVAPCGSLGCAAGAAAGSRGA
jgi:hypothetical protein